MSHHLKTERLSPAECKAEVERFGGVRTAAVALGIPYSTFRYWLNPEPTLKRQRRRYHADPETARKRMRDDYHGESTVQRIRRKLRNRRTHALRRMAQREER